MDENRLRDELIERLRMSLAKSWETITNPHLDATTRERWTQIHTNASLALNQILKDRQNKDWEKRLRELEAGGLLQRGSARRLETPPARPSQEAADGSREAEQDKPPGKEGAE